MISRSLKKHRITRWNILQTATASALGLTFALAAALPAFGADNDGSISLRAVRPTPVPAAVPSVTSGQNTDAQDLLRSIRSGVPVKKTPQISPSQASLPEMPQVVESPPIPEIPASTQLRSATKGVQKLRSIPADGMRMNDVLLLSGQEDTAGTIIIPELQIPPEQGGTVSDGNHLLPTPSNAVDQPVVNSVKRTRTTRRGVTKYFNWDKTVNIFKGRTGKSKTRQRGRFIEFYDPEDERPDVDDYDMPILLVAAQEEQAPEEVQGNVDDAGERLLKRKLTDIQPTLAYAWGEKDDTVLPKDFHKRMDNGDYVSIVAPRSVLQWEPTNLWYYPLYFEDPGLERYGHTRRPLIQPFVSTGRFFGQVATLPYHMALNSPKCPQYALGYYQPGEWAPKKKYQIPFNEEAAATQFLWTVGLILLIP